MDQFLGEIRAVGFNYAPKGWALCQGQLLPIAQNAALYSLLGVSYGGDGTTTFALPNLSSRVAVGMGTAATGTPYPQGMQGGSEAVTVTTAQLPTHQHPVQGATLSGQTGGTATASPDGAYFGSQGGSLYAGGAGNGNLAASAVVGQSSSAGASTPHANIQPYLAISYIIATNGIYPSQS